MPASTRPIPLVAVAHLVAQRQPAACARRPAFRASRYPIGSGGRRSRRQLEDHRKVVESAPCRSRPGGSASAYGALAARAASSSSRRQRSSLKRGRAGARVSACAPLPLAGGGIDGALLQLCDLRRFRGDPLGDQSRLVERGVELLSRCPRPPAPARSAIASAPAKAAATTAAATVMPSWLLADTTGSFDACGVSCRARAEGVALRGCGFAPGDSPLGPLARLWLSPAPGGCLDSRLAVESRNVSGRSTPSQRGPSRGPVRPLLLQGIVQELLGGDRRRSASDP